MTHKQLYDLMINVGQAVLPHVFQICSATSLPFACVSNALNKPKPLNLDVSLPSIHDLSLIHISEPTRLLFMILDGA